MKRIVSIFAFVLISLCLLLIIGCAGTPFNWEDARKIQPGMTEEEVINIMGKPYMVTATGQKQIWAWSYASTFGGAKSFAITMVEGKVVGDPASVSRTMGDR